MFEAATQSIFISYRREDAAAYAGRLADRLGELVGVDRIFMDVEDIRPGQNFAETIDHTLAQCGVVLVVIGPHWLPTLQQRAAAGQDDYVVHEIAAALARKAVIVPVLVGGVTAASLTGLPPALAELPFHQAVELHDTSFIDDCSRLAAALRLRRAGYLGRSWPWLALTAAAAAIALAVGAGAGVGPWRAAHERRARVAQLLGTAAVQSREGEYASAFDSFQQVLDLDAANAAALDGRVDAAMSWLEHFHVLVGEGEKAGDLAGPPLARMKAVLEAGLARSGDGSARAADILAHLGWAHWLNQKIAFKEVDGAEALFNRALAIDSTNVYANAMLGNWLLQTHGDTTAALRHFQTAVATGRQRPLVRSMQVGGLLHNDEPGLRAELVKVLNAMRQSGEPLEPALRTRARYLYDLAGSQDLEFREVLAAVPADENWQTLLWLSQGSAPDESELRRRELVHASLTELSGDRRAAAAEFKALVPKLEAADMSDRLIRYAQAAIVRLSR